jgi:hypothetical protein|tara:strand:- start:273 stop:512 length:240 start_codon:yes stop_codon:yes gene_type:complete
MKNQEAIHQLVSVELMIDVICRPLVLADDPRDLTQEEDYRLGSLHMLASEIRHGMSREDINKAFNIFLEYVEGDLAVEW